MKKLHRYVFLVFALVSVAMVAWAIIAGMSAPDSAKIANSTPLVQQFDADGNAVNTEDDQPVPVATTQDGQTGIIDGNHVQGEMDVTYLAMGYAAMPLRQGVNFQYYNDYMMFPISMKKTGSSALAVKSSEPASFKCTDLKVLTMKKAERRYMKF